MVTAAHNMISCRRNKDLGKIPEQNLTDQLIFIFTVVQKLLPVVTLWHILFKTCNVELSERSTLFLSGNILNTVYFICVIIKPQQFHSYRTISDYEPDQCRNPNPFFGFKHLIKAITSINHGASSSGMACFLQEL